MTRRTLRDDIVALHDEAEAFDRVPPHKRTTTAHQQHRRRVLTLARRLEKRTRPAEVPQLRMPGEGTVAHAVLAALHADVRGYGHNWYRKLTGVTDAELAVRVQAKGGANSVRPRRVELQRAGWIMPAPRGKVNGQQAWTLTDAGLEAWRRG